MGFMGLWEIRVSGFRVYGWPNGDGFWAAGALPAVFGESEAIARARMDDLGDAFFPPTVASLLRLPAIGRASVGARASVVIVQFSRMVFKGSGVSWQGAIGRWRKRRVGNVGARPRKSSSVDGTFHKPVCVLSVRQGVEGMSMWVVSAIRASSTSVARSRSPPLSSVGTLIFYLGLLDLDH